MPKKFNITGICIPEENYMADMSGRVDRIVSAYIEEGKYFTINRARQYGKTTMLYLLEKQLKENYLVLSLSFEAAGDYFSSPLNLAEGLIMDIRDALVLQKVPSDIIEEWSRPVDARFPIRSLGSKITALCRSCRREIVLMIDEVDQSSDNQIFLTFLGLLRSKYLQQRQGKDITFKSVILAGVYDIKNLKLKLHPGEESKYNSPWNIAADFDVDMHLYTEDIASMLKDYENDYHTGMDICYISQLIFDYTSGYPYLVSRICQLIEESVQKGKFADRKSAWTHEGVVLAEQILRKESNTLFDDMVKKLNDYPKLKEMIYRILFMGRSYPFDRENMLVNLGVTFGFLKDNDGTVALANRIFETRIYDLFICEMAIESEMGCFLCI
ncbi:MAG: AAA-like domain-containing protein [Eubacteriales bacterium]|nr:AAA-like domain-containing protein [Eubacteriales bacterium]